MQLDPTQPGQDSMLGLAAGRTGGEPDREPVVVLGLEPGNPTGAPLRFPGRESPQFFNARANPSRPVLNASFEHSPHHGATSPLAAFHSLRSEYSDHEIEGVRPSSLMP
jgi:hypothetical protein